MPRTRKHVTQLSLFTVTEPASAPQTSAPAPTIAGLLLARCPVPRSAQPTGINLFHLQRAVESLCYEDALVLGNWVLEYTVPEDKGYKYAPRPVYRVLYADNLLAAFDVHGSQVTRAKVVKCLQEYGVWFQSKDKQEGYTLWAYENDEEYDEGWTEDTFGVAQLKLIA